LARASATSVTSRFCRSIISSWTARWSRGWAGTSATWRCCERSSRWRALDLEIIAEGVENEEQRGHIAKEGCAFYQGFLRAQPMSAEMFGKLVASSRA